MNMQRGAVSAVVVDRCSGAVFSWEKKKKNSVKFSKSFSDVSASESSRCLCPDVGGAFFGGGCCFCSRALPPLPPPDGRARFAAGKHVPLTLLQVVVCLLGNLPTGSAQRFGRQQMKPRLRRELHFHFFNEKQTDQQTNKLGGGGSRGAAAV